MADSLSAEESKIPMIMRIARQHLHMTKKHKNETQYCPKIYEITLRQAKEKRQATRYVPYCKRAIACLNPK
jgi:hypothetical protein